MQKGDPLIRQVLYEPQFAHFNATTWKGTVDSQNNMRKELVTFSHYALSISQVVKTLCKPCGNLCTKSQL